MAEQTVTVPRQMWHEEGELQLTFPVLFEEGDYRFSLCVPHIRRS